MFKKFDTHARYFQGVAIATLLCGAAVVAVGLVEMGSNLWGNMDFSNPFLKIVGGLVVTSLGYIHLELELMRTK